MSHIPKGAAALLAVAAVFSLGQVGGRLGDSDEGSNALPEPQQMAALALDRRTTIEIVGVWEAKVAEQPQAGAFRSQHASALLALASETGDLTLYELADEVALGAIRVDPGDATAKLTRAAALSGQHDFQGALDLIDQALEDDPESISALLALGDARLELGDDREAASAYQAAAIALEGQPPAVLSRLARLESLRGNTPRALELSEAALIGAADIDLRLADAAFYWFQLAHYQFQTGAIDEAEASARSALIVDPTNLGATELLAKIVAALGNDDGAINLYLGLLDRGPAADLHGELAKLYSRRGRDDEAGLHIEAGLALARETGDRFPAERRHLIGFLADHEPEEALRLAALDLESRQDVYSHAWFAWALLRTGDSAGALDAIQPVLEIAIDDPWLLYQAGAIQAANGNEAEAMALLAEALAINPVFDVEHAERARRLLAERSDEIG